MTATNFHNLFLGDISLGRDVPPPVGLFLLAIEESMRFFVNLKPSTKQEDIVQLAMEEKDTHFVFLRDGHELWLWPVSRPWFVLYFSTSIGQSRTGGMPGRYKRTV